MNAKQELIEHVGGRRVKYVSVTLGRDWQDDRKSFNGTLAEVLPLLDFQYDSGYGGQELFGFIWYEDGTWSERGEYDGSEWWEHKVCPPLPEAAQGKVSA